MSDKEPRGDVMNYEGIVENVIKDKVFVKIEDRIIIATISGKIRQSGIRILPGDLVKIEVSVYDTSKGRVVYRLKS
jgi:translation initiation factor IF-1